MERVAAVIWSTGWSAFRLSAYPPSAEMASSAGIAHSNPAEKALRTARLLSSGPATSAPDAARPKRRDAPEPDTAAPEERPR